MAAETPNPTLAQVRANYADAPRPRRGINELLRRLEINLPAAITDYNTQNGLTGDLKVRQPTGGIRLAPSFFGDGWINTIAVGPPATMASPQGPGAYTNSLLVAVFSVDAPVSCDTQLKVEYGRAEVICAVLKHFLTNCFDASGRQAWRLLEFQGITPFPQQMGEYSGSVVMYRMTQPPEDV